MILDSMGRIGLRRTTPEAEIDIRTQDIDDGSEVHIQLQQQSDITNDLLKLMNNMQASNIELQNRMKQIEAALPDVADVQSKK